MYCPVCGAESTQGLNYCKRCGAGLSASTPPIEPRGSFGRMMGMLLPLAIVSIGGFVALFTTVYSLGERANFDTKALIGIMAFGGATVVCVIGLLVWLMLRLSGYEPIPQKGKPEAKQVREYIPQQLPPSSTNAPSITEHTTRNFDPFVRREKSSE